MTLETLDVSPNGAVISSCNRYRYRLRREVKPTVEEKLDKGKYLGKVLWVMLNPSTADASKDDPTIRRCIGYTRYWGYGRLEVVNLFGFRATNPKELKKRKDPIGSDNDRYIRQAADRADIIIAAWGANCTLGGRYKSVINMLRGPKLHALAFTKDGHPRHPLYLKKDLQPQAWSP